MTRRIILFDSKNYQNQVCLSPFVSVEIDVQGNVRMCGCQAWMPTIVGNLFEQSLPEMLSSPLARAIRTSIADGTYRYCNEKTCGIIASGALNSVHTVPPEVALQLKDNTRWSLPHEIFLAGDLTCNLSCPSCRNSVITVPDHEVEQQMRLGEILRANLFPEPTDQSIKIHVSTSGEVFASPRLLSFINSLDVDQFPNLRIHLQTNGLLMPARWHRLGNMSQRVDKVTVTVDAAQANTYELLRRGGRWADIVKALEWSSDHCVANNIDLHLRMVVQRDNWQQMQEFYDMAMLYKATLVEFTRISNWGTFDAVAFAEVDVFDPQHDQYVPAQNLLQQIRILPNVFVSGGL